MDQAGSSSDAYFSGDSSPTDDYRVQDSISRALRPTTTYRSSLAVERPPGAFELMHVVLDFDPGVRTPWHMHGGQEFAMPIAGELTLQRQDDVQVFAAGESWVNTSGVVHAAVNDGRSFARVVATFLLPAGRRLTTFL
jgi:quercetin dioxygenase-like cupin family protein